MEALAPCLQRTQSLQRTHSAVVLVDSLPSTSGHVPAQKRNEHLGCRQIHRDTPHKTPTNIESVIPEERLFSIYSYYIEYVKGERESVYYVYLSNS
jgi:hypothetical protein